MRLTGDTLEEWDSGQGEREKRLRRRLNRVTWLPERETRHALTAGFIASTSYGSISEPSISVVTQETVRMSIQAVLQTTSRRHAEEMVATVVTQGHPAYRRVVIEMHRLIAEKAGHRAVADAMTHMTFEAPALERLDSERKAENRRNS